MWNSLKDIEDMIALEYLMHVYVKLDLIDDFFWYQGDCNEMYVQMSVNGVGIEWTNG